MKPKRMTERERLLKRIEDLCCNAMGFHSQGYNEATALAMDAHDARLAEQHAAKRRARK